MITNILAAIGGGILFVLSSFGLYTAPQPINADTPQQPLAENNHQIGKSAQVISSRSIDVSALLVRLHSNTDRTRIMVNLVLPSDLPKNAQGLPPDESDGDLYVQYTQKITNLENAVITDDFGQSPTALESAPHELTTSYIVTPFFAVNATAAEIRTLANDPRVATIDADVQLRPNSIN